MIEPMTSQSENKMICANDLFLNRLKKQGFNPIKQVLNNLISKAKIKAIEMHGLRADSLLIGAHRRNTAEIAIQTAKNHIKTCTTRMWLSFPMNLWDHLFPQIEHTCNLLHLANANSCVLAHQGLYDNHHYHLMPVHPMGYAIPASMTPHCNNPGRKCTRWTECENKLKTLQNIWYMDQNNVGHPKLQHCILHVLRYFFIGTTNGTKFIYECEATSKKDWIDWITSNPLYPKIKYTHTINQNMERKSNSKNQQTPHPKLTTRGTKSSKKSWAQSYSIHKL